MSICLFFCCCLRGSMTNVFCLIRDFLKKSKRVSRRRPCTARYHNEGSCCRENFSRFFLEFRKSFKKMSHIRVIKERGTLHAHTHDHTHTIHLR